jgi:hypothetical protein
VLFTANAHRDNGKRFIVVPTKNSLPFLSLKESHTMTVIEIKPQRWGWKVFEAPSVEPVFPEKRQAIAGPLRIALAIPVQCLLAAFPQTMRSKGHKQMRVLDFPAAL